MRNFDKPSPVPLEGTGSLPVLRNEVIVRGDGGTLLVDGMGKSIQLPADRAITAVSNILGGQIDTVEMLI